MYDERRRGCGRAPPVRFRGKRYILGAMASTWRLQRQLPRGESRPRLLRDMLTVPALIARGPQLVGIVLGVAIAAQAVALALSLWGEFAAASTVGAAAKAHLREKQRMALEGITAAHLFGAAPEVTKVAGVVSRAPLVLTGTLATGNPRDGFAIVGTSASSAHVIYVGSEAVPGTILVKVFPTWVVLQRGDERVTLRFPRGPRVGGGAIGGGGALYSALQGDESAPAPEESDAPAFATHATLTRPRVTDDAAVVRSFGGLLPAKTADGQDGEKIMGTALNSKALAAMGLHGGDVIVQINGVPIDAPNAPDLIRALQSGSVTLTVDRGGEDTSVSLDTSSMAGAATAYRQADADL